MHRFTKDMYIQLAHFRTYIICHCYCSKCIWVDNSKQIFNIPHHGFNVRQLVDDKNEVCPFITISDFGYANDCQFFIYKYCVLLPQVIWWKPTSFSILKSINIHLSRCLSNRNGKNPLQSGANFITYLQMAKTFYLDKF